MKTEPFVFSIDDLAAAPNQSTFWDGVRNYQAAHFMRDEMQLEDLVLVYHSNATLLQSSGRENRSNCLPRSHSLEQNRPHFDPKSDPSKPTWFMVDIRFVTKFHVELSLSSLRQQPELAKMELLRKGSRLSVQPVRKSEFEFILDLARKTGMSHEID